MKNRLLTLKFVVIILALMTISCNSKVQNETLTEENYLHEDSLLWITFNNETVQIKDMSITYADGHAYISDSHVTIDLGEITDNTISMAGSWYFITDLMRGSTTYKMIYEWDWQDFILDNVQFCVIYIGLALIGLLIARHYCTLTITDYAIFLVSIVIALTIQVIA